MDWFSLIMLVGLAIFAVKFAKGFVEGIKIASEKER